MTIPVPSQFYEHQDGGIYKVICTGTSTDDGTSELVVYEHVYPFDQRIWVRPIVEWTTTRFRRLTPAEMVDKCAVPRVELQERIATAKATRRENERKQYAQRHIDDMYGSVDTNVNL